MSFLLVPSAIVLVFWLLLIADFRRWWPTDRYLDLEATDERPSGIVVVIPARNEADVLESTLPTLLSQREDYERLVLVDDRSDDGSGDLARRLIDRCGASGSACVIAGSEPPDGWSGKLHALQTGIDAVLAEEAQPQGWFLFTDADILHPSGSIRALHATAVEGRFDLVSVMVRLQSSSFWERLLIPPFVYFFQLLYPFRRVADGKSRVAAAAGGCVLVRRTLLEKMGGLPAMRGAVIDDVTLARKAKAAGGRLWLGLCATMVSARPYRRLTEIVQMISRTAFTQLRYNYFWLTLTLLAMVVFLLSPPALCTAAAASGDGRTLLVAAGAWAVQAASLLPAVRHQGVSAAYSLTLPFASMIFAWATLVSAWNHFRGRGARWKGRELP